jgi:hypothetical protein
MALSDAKTGREEDEEAEAPIAPGFVFREAFLRVPSALAGNPMSAPPQPAP